MRIGIIGEGRIGGTVGRLLKEAGHDIRFGARAPAGLGPNDIPEVSIRDAAFSGDVVLCAVPFKSWPELAGELANVVIGKVVIDTANADENRDGNLAVRALASADGVAGVVSALLPTARLVRTFSTIEAGALAENAHRDGERMGLPVAGADPAAVAIASVLVHDAGFDPVELGNLTQARRFDSDSKVFNTGMTAGQIRAALGLTT